MLKVPENLNIFTNIWFSTKNNQKRVSTTFSKLRRPNTSDPPLHIQFCLVLPNLPSSGRGGRGGWLNVLYWFPLRDVYSISLYSQQGIFKSLKWPRQTNYKSVVCPFNFSLWIDFQRILVEFCNKLSVLWLYLGFCTQGGILSIRNRIRTWALWFNYLYPSSFFHFLLLQLLH